MYAIVVFCATILGVFGTPSGHGRIFGGTEIAIEQVPYQASFEYFGSHICGASIISPGYVLTTGNCAYGLEPAFLTVRAGTITREQGGQVVNVTNTYIHPDYYYVYMSFNIAVVELATSLELGFRTAVIALPEVGQTWSIGTNALVTGWGGSEIDIYYTANLKGVTIQLGDTKTCEDTYLFDFPSMFCGGVAGSGDGACMGDYGGPLQIDGVLAGIASKGFCGNTVFIGLFTNVSLIMDFILDVTGDL